MTLYENWFTTAFTKEGSANPKVWEEYSPKETAVYVEILSQKTTHISGTVKEFSEKHDMSTVFTIGFLDGIREALPEPIDCSEYTEETQLDFDIDFELLYKKMVEYKADALYNLPEWDNIFDEETQQRLYTEQRISTTVVKPKKVGRNDACPCGSGKKYKKCCGI